MGDFLLNKNFISTILVCIQVLVVFFIAHACALSCTLVLTIFFTSFLHNSICYLPDSDGTEDHSEKRGEEGVVLNLPVIQEDGTDLWGEERSAGVEDRREGRTRGELMKDNHVGQRERRGRRTHSERT